MSQSTIPTVSNSTGASIGTPSWMLWTGRVISGLLVALFSASAVPKFIPSLAAGMEKAGWSPTVAPVLGVTELLCAVLYAIPQTSVLGAILLTGYMGGAIATHARIGEPFVAQIVIGMLIWVGLFLREARLRSLIPLRR